MPMSILQVSFIVFGRDHIARGLFGLAPSCKVPKLAIKDDSSVPRGTPNQNVSSTELSRGARDTGHCSRCVFASSVDIDMSPSPSGFFLSP